MSHETFAYRHCSLVFLSAPLAALAQPLSGTYGGSARGSDPTNPLIEMARFRFARNGTLTAIYELYMWGFSATPCELSADTTGQPNPDPYTLFNQNLTVIGPAPGHANSGYENTYFIAASQGCPAGSANQTPETLIVIPERGASEFDYIIYEYPFGSLGGQIPERVVGHAIKK